MCKKVALNPIHFNSFTKAIGVIFEAKPLHTPQSCNLMSQKIQDIDLLSYKCWATVCDAGPTFITQSFNVHFAEAGVLNQIQFQLVNIYWICYDGNYVFTIISVLTGTCLFKYVSLLRKALLPYLSASY